MWGPCGLMVLVTAGCADRSPETQRLSGTALGTYWQVSWVEVDDVSPEQVEAVILETLEGVDARMSSWRDDSELTRARQAEGRAQVSVETAAVVEKALSVAEQTGGAFDPTVEPLLDFWGFRDEPRQTLPTDDELDELLAGIGWQQVEVGHEPDGSAWIDTGGTALDLSAIAKGHASDRVAHALSRLGLVDHLVDLGGDVRAAGRNAAGVPWRIGIDEPRVGTLPGEAIAAVLGLPNGAVTTSGNYRSRVEVEGRTLGHIMDPRTGWPAQSDVLSATVLAPDCITADVWATALLVLEPDAGLALIEARPDKEALLLVEAGDGWVPRGTTGLDDFLVRAPDGYEVLVPDPAREYPGG